MGLYRTFVVPRITDLAMRNRRLGLYRERAVRAAEGQVLEIGIGSGLNLERYPCAVLDLLALEPDPNLIRMAKRRKGTSAEYTRPVSYLEASAEEIPLESASVDTVVSTWTMCTIPHLRRALGEMRRVLRPNGHLLFVEHGLAPEGNLQKWQHRVDPLWHRVSGGCHLNRPIAELVAEAGFSIDDLRTGYMGRPKLMTFMYEGVARPH